MLLIMRHSSVCLYDYRVRSNHSGSHYFILKYVCVCVCVCACVRFKKLLSTSLVLC